MWGAALKFVGGALAGAAIERTVDKAVDWHDEKRAAQQIRDLFHQGMVDDAGQVPADRLRFEVADLVFTATPLALDGLDAPPVHHVEVVKTELSAVDPNRVREFGYRADTFGFWRERTVPVRSSPVIPGWHPMYDKPGGPVGKGGNDLDPTWFPAALAIEVVDLLPIAGVAVNIRKRIALNRQIERATERLLGLLHNGTAAYQPDPDRFPVSDGGWTLWVTPLRSSATDKVTSYHLVAANSALPADHPNRVVAFRYAVATRDLRAVVRP